MKRRSRKTLPLLAWRDREKDLAKVKRYGRFPVMFYRTDLAIHSVRVQAIVRELLPTVLEHYPELDPKKALLISKFHDDYEMVSKRGDVQLQLKLQMSKDELLELKQEELAGIEYLVEEYGDRCIEGYSYRDLLMHSLTKDCPEAQLHSFADKLDGYCEAWHEVFACNLFFIEPVVNYVMHSFNDMPSRFPLISKVFNGHGHFHFPVIEIEGYMPNLDRPHTQASLSFVGQMPHYEMWKRLTLALPDGLSLLIDQRERYTDEKEER